jgi:hypothetical protein
LALTEYGRDHRSVRGAERFGLLAGRAQHVGQARGFHNMVKKTVDREAIVLAYNLQKAGRFAFAGGIERVLALRLGPAGDK